MNKLFKFTLFVLSVILLASCSDKKMDLYLENIPDSFQIVLFEKGKEINSYRVDKNNERHEVIFSWLKKNQKEWTLDMTTYAPVLIINSEKLKINFLLNDNLVVVNYENKKGNWIQVSKHIEESQIISIKGKFIDDELNE